jgi:Protein of unknown function (DUF3106)
MFLIHRILIVRRIKVKHMQRLVAAVVFSVSLYLTSALIAAYAETPDPASMSAEERRAAYDAMNDQERIEFRQKMRQLYENMSPEEREAAKQKARERFESMTPEEREAAKQKARERYENMTPEERKAMKEKRKLQRKARSNGERP